VTAKQTCLITGATGLLGRALCHHFSDNQWDVRGLARSPDALQSMGDAVQAFRGDLPDQVPDEAFENVDVVIHCAYMSRHTTHEEARRVNVEGTARVRAAALAAGARFVFISSTGAHEDALSYYGQSKKTIEESLDPSTDLIIRPGLILGPGGLFQRIRDSLDSFGVVPVFEGGRQQIQTVHVEDLCHAIHVAVQGGRTGTFVVAEEDGIELRDLFRSIADRLGKRCILLPLPAGPLLLVLRGAESMGLRLPLSSENVLGAKSLRTQPSAADLADLGIELRGTGQSLDDLLRNEGG